MEPLTGWERFGVEGMMILTLLVLMSAMGAYILRLRKEYGAVIAEERANNKALTERLFASLERNAELIASVKLSLDALNDNKMDELKSILLRGKAYD